MRPEMRPPTTHDLLEQTFPLFKLVARDGVEPSTFRFSVQSPPDRSRTTWHFACCSCLVEAPEVPRGPELLDSPLDTARRYIGRSQAALTSRCAAPAVHGDVVYFMPGSASSSSTSR